MPKTPITAEPTPKSGVVADQALPAEGGVYLRSEAGALQLQERTASAPERAATDPETPKTGD